MNYFHLRNAIKKMEKSNNYDILELEALKDELEKKKKKLPKLRIP